MAAQVRGGLLRRPLQAEGRDEPAVLVHQIGDGGMVHPVVIALGRHLPEVDAVLLGHRRDRVQVTGEAGDVRVEARHVVLEHGLGVALRIDGDEHRAGAIGIGPERPHDLGYVVHRGRAHVRAMRVAEEDE